MPKKDLLARMPLHCNLEWMGCVGLMSSLWNLADNNRIIMEIVGEPKVKKRWKEMLRGKLKEWMKAMIASTNKLKNGIEKLVAGKNSTDQFFTIKTNAGNDGYNLNDCVAKNNEGLAMVIKFLNPILTPDQPS